MFVSQVTFSGDKEQEEKLINIIKNKMSGTKGVAGLIVAECWRREEQQEVSYTLTTRWEDKEAFRVWLSKDDHGKKHREMKGQERPNLKKTACQYEVVEFC